MRKDDETAEFFAMRVAEAYMYHTFALHRRPVYRHEVGDIGINRNVIAGLLNGHLSHKLSAKKRTSIYIRLMKALAGEADSRTVVSAGGVPELNKRGIRYVNAILHQYGDMYADLGVWDDKKKLVIPDEVRARYGV